MAQCHITIIYSHYGGERNKDSGFALLSLFIIFVRRHRHDRDHAVHHSHSYGLRRILRLPYERG